MVLCAALLPPRSTQVYTSSHAAANSTELAANDKTKMAKMLPTGEVYVVVTQYFLNVQQHKGSSE